MNDYEIAQIKTRLDNVIAPNDQNRVIQDFRRVMGEVARLQTELQEAQRDAERWRLESASHESVKETLRLNLEQAEQAIASAATMQQYKDRVVEAAQRFFGVNGEHWFDRPECATLRPILIGETRRCTCGGRELGATLRELAEARECV